MSHVSKKPRVIIDVDDVLLELNLHVAEQVRQMGYPDFQVENILTYDLNKTLDKSCLPEHQRDLMDNGLGCSRDLILSLYRDPNIFKTVPLTCRFEEGLKLLTEIFEVIINSNNFTLDIIEEKLKLFKHFCKDLDLQYNFCVSSDKPLFNDVYAVFEDNIENLKLYSDDCIKLLVDRPQNQERYNGKLLVGIKNLYRVDSFYAGVKKLVEELSY